eukprot:scaffold10560_cov133-Isochrysis_galbana.AAC.2
MDFVHYLSPFDRVEPAAISIHDFRSAAALTHADHGGSRGNHARARSAKIFSAIYGAEMHLFCGPWWPSGAFIAHTGRGRRAPGTWVGSGRQASPRIRRVMHY